MSPLVSYWYSQFLNLAQRMSFLLEKLFGFKNITQLTNPRTTAEQPETTVCGLITFYILLLAKTIDWIRNWKQIMSACLQILQVAWTISSCCKNCKLFCKMSKFYLRLLSKLCWNPFIVHSSTRRKKTNKQTVLKSIPVSYCWIYMKQLEIVFSLFENTI